MFQVAFPALDHEVLVRSAYVVIEELNALLKQVHLHTQGENSTQHKHNVNRTMDTLVCAHSEVSLQYSVNNREPIVC